MAFPALHRKGNQSALALKTLMSYSWVEQEGTNDAVLIAEGTVIVGRVRWSAAGDYEAVHRDWLLGRSLDRQKAKRMVEGAEETLRSSYSGTSMTTWLVTFGESRRGEAGLLRIDADKVVRIGANVLVADGVVITLDAPIDSLTDSTE